MLARLLRRRVAASMMADLHRAAASVGTMVAAMMQTEPGRELTPGEMKRAEDILVDDAEAEVTKGLLTQSTDCQEFCFAVLPTMMAEYRSEVRKQLFAKVPSQTAGSA